MAGKGWTKLYREQFNHWISKKPFCDGYAWTYLCNRSNHKKGMVNFRNEYIEVDRGKILTSKLKLQDIFGWTYRHVENFLKALRNDDMVTYRTTNRYIVITIIKYNIYQGSGEQNGEQNEEQVKNRLGTGLERGNTNKNEENVKNDNNGKNRDSADRTIFHEQIIYYLNTETGKDYKPTTKLTIKLINARLKEGYLLNDFKKVIDVKNAEWKGRFTKDGKNMEDWLRPETLFGNKFESYLNQNSESSDSSRFDFIDEEEKAIE